MHSRQFQQLIKADTLHRNRFKQSTSEVLVKAALLYGFIVSLLAITFHLAS